MNPYKMQKHDIEVTKILKETGCMGSKGQIRRITKEVWKKLSEAGHSSIGPVYCKCQEIK